MIALLVGAARDAAPALARLLGAVGRSFPGVVLVVAHRGGAHDEEDGLVEHARLRCALPVRVATDKAPLRKGEVILAPPAYHLLVEDGRCVLSADPPESGERPAIAALFETAVAALGPGCVGVLLGETGPDGAVAAAAFPYTPSLLQGRADGEDDLVSRVLHRLDEVPR